MASNKNIKELFQQWNEEQQKLQSGKRGVVLPISPKDLLKHQANLQEMVSREQRFAQVSSETTSLKIDADIL